MDGLMVRDAASRLLTMRVRLRATLSGLILRSPPSAGVSKDAQCPGHEGALSAHAIAPESCQKPPSKSKEGAGNAGCFSQHPRPRVQMEEAHERSRHR